MADPLPAPSNPTCKNSTNGLNVSWEAVNDTTCARSDVEYLVTVIRERHMMIIVPSMTAAETAVELTNTQGLERNTTYVIYVKPRTLVGSCGGE